MKIKIIILPIILLLSLNISLSQSKADLISQIDDKERKYKFYYNRLKDSLNFRNHEISLKFNKIIDSLKKENLYYKHQFK